MVVLSKKTITEYGAKNAQAVEGLAIWYAIASQAEWANLNEVKRDLNATDYIGNDRYVFNIKGNRYRLLAMMFFVTKRLYIRGIFTHGQYSKLFKKQIIEM